MDSRFFYILTLLNFFAICHGQNPPAPRFCRIRWSDVQDYSFRVRWPDNSGRCDTYRINIYRGYTNKVVKSMDEITFRQVQVKDLNSSTVYGVKVACVDKAGNQSPFSRACRTRTFGRRITATTTPAPTAPAPVGACGLGNFTCETDESCVSAEMWCNRQFDCKDRTDERNCPGHCPEITQEGYHVKGNFSCSMWNSRRSACFFQCANEWVRVGPFYIVCVLGEWTREVPTCKIEKPALFINRVTSDEFELFVDHSHDTTNVEIYSIADGDGNDVSEEVEFSYTAESRHGATAYIRRLRPNTAYTFRLVGIDVFGDLGLPSDTLRSKTSAA